MAISRALMQELLAKARRVSKKVLGFDGSMGNSRK
jgi:hypothetical protein